ncbi:MAG: transcription termination/antitermination protein NusG [Actinomycetota bacterium]|nr:transcription termination/antitermination protein NusG [Actinomycetota bacterium]
MEDRAQRGDASTETDEPSAAHLPPVEETGPATEEPLVPEDSAAGAEPRTDQPEPEEVAAREDRLDTTDQAPAEEPTPAEPEADEAEAGPAGETLEAEIREAARPEAAPDVSETLEAGPDAEVEPPAPTDLQAVPQPEEPQAAEAEEGLRETEVARMEEPGAEAAQAETAEEAPPAAPTPEATPAKPAAKAKRAEPAAVAEGPSGDGAGVDPFSGPGEWYVVHTYAGYENKVKTNLQTRVQTMQMQDKIFDVQIPMEDVMEIKGGKKQVVQKKVFPGYLLVKMVYDDDSWVCVRNTPGVTGFVSAGSGQRPTPLPRREVEKILTKKEEEAKKPAFRLEFEEGDVVRIIAGPFADFNGTISDINVDQSKVRVMVNIFDRETPVELSFDQVARV